jgi:tRNA (cytidine56-2'-O)-methyltransferase
MIKKKDLLVIVGGSKVPGKVYELSDVNISVTSQPISEISALSYFLDYLFERKFLDKEFKGAKLKIVPQKKGKKVLKL